MEKSRRDDWTLSIHHPGFEERRRSAKEIASGNFQSSLRDFSFLESLPRTASWAKFSRPSGTHSARGLGSTVFLEKGRQKGVETQPATFE
jgi:hypothetical protein